MNVPRSSPRLECAAGVALALLLVAPPSAAQAPSKASTLASGERGRTYHDLYGVNLVKLLPAFRVKNRATTGSLENLELLADQKAELGFGQVDVYAARLRGDEARYAGLTVIGRLSDECVYIAYRVGGPIASVAALGEPVEGRQAKIAVGPSGGGMSGTWSFMASLEPTLAAAAVVNTGGTLALNQLSIGLLDAVGWVTDPRNLDHVLLRAVHANAELDLLAVDLPKLEHSLADGTRIYEIKSVAVTAGRRPQPLETLCTSAMIFAGPGANPRLVEAVSKVLSLEREKLLRAR